MRFFLGMLYTETNIHAPLPTGRRSFELGGFARGTASSRPDTIIGALLAEWRRLAEADGHVIAEGLAATAEPAGPTVGAVYEELRDMLLDDLRAALPVDAVLLNLHGAMAAVGYDDCEGDMLQRVRAIVGPGTVIGVELDLHCNVTPAMFDHADVMIAYKEYPHVDELERGRELYRIVRDAATGHCRPVTARFDCRMIGLWPTTDEPMRGFVDRMHAAEREPGILSVSLGHGFPWADLPWLGAWLWVVADRDAAAAAVVAERLGRDFYGLREATRAEFVDIDTALDLATATQGTTVLADVADNPGGGAAGDATFLLRRIVARGVRGVASGCYWDPSAVAICHQAGVGARLRLRIGGKVGPASGDPIDLDVIVRAIAADHAQTGFAGVSIPYGASAWVESQGIDLVLVSERNQVFGPDSFTRLGIDLATRRIVVVKSRQHFHAQFAPLAAAILYVVGEGAVSPDVTRIPYRRLARTVWPLDADPLAPG